MVTVDGLFTVIYIHFTA